MGGDVFDWAAVYKFVRDNMIGERWKDGWRAS